MIEAALHFLCTELDAYLRRRFDLASEAARLGAIVDDDGRATGGCRVVLSVVRIDEEHPRPIHGNRRRIPSDGRPSTYLSVYILVTASGATDYREGLKSIGAAVNFFEAHTGFSHAQWRHLPEGLDGMVIELMGLDFAAMNNLWAYLGARYRPSVLYRLRSVPITAPSVVRTPSIESIAIEGLS